MAERIMNRNTVAALIAGALVGAGVAMLFAPQSGRRTRHDIRRFAETVGDQAEAAQIHLQRSIDSIVGEAEEKILDVVNCGKQWTDTGITELQRALDAVRKTVTGGIDKIKAA
jgi:gas vesicle protein